MLDANFAATLDFLGEVVFFHAGKWILFLITAGRINPQIKTSKHASLVSLFGFLAVTAILITTAYYLKNR